jgi:hypothetical protein
MGGKKSRKRKSKKGKGKKKNRYSAKTADPFELYQHSVQDVEAEVEILAAYYEELSGGTATHLREDFSGTALLSSRWIGQGEEYTAEAYDIDPDPVSWGMMMNFAPLGSDAERCEFHLEDVRVPSSRPPDIRVALNFSYRALKKRSELLEYFRGAYEDLAEGGLFVIDNHGGYDTTKEVKEKRKVDQGFTYVWDQVSYLPATGDYVCHIHFHFPDKTKLRKAFTYDWRLWTTPELTDVLTDAGFREVVSYFEGTDDDGESGSGEFERSDTGEECPSWLAYLVAVK